MTQFYYYLVLADALACFVIAGVVLWKNRYQAIGPTFGVAMIMLAGWLLCYAQYFRPMAENEALVWARFTLSFAIMLQPVLFHSLCTAADRTRVMRWWTMLAYGMAFFFLAALWRGFIVAGLKQQCPYMDHYVFYQRNWYLPLGVHLVFWQFLAAAVLVRTAYAEIGYRRTYLVYFTVAWLIMFLTIHITILPLEYDINIQPFGFFVLPLNLGILAYVLSKTRLADYHVVIARVLLHSITLVVVVAVSLLFVGTMALVAPTFMNQEQVLFTLTLVVTVGFALTATLPRWLPRAERIMQERMFAKRFGYQDALAGMVKELGRVPTIDQVLETVATTVHRQMQVARVLMIMQDPLTGVFKVVAASGVNEAELAGLAALPENARMVQFFHDHHEIIARDELARRGPAHKTKEIAAEMDRLHIAVAVPMMLDDKLIGIMGVGEKINRQMFFVSDLRLLETLATEISLTVRYRRMQEEFLRKNKLAELGTVAAGVAHEIRNPLASIRTFAQLLPTKMDDPEFKNEFSQLVLKDVDRITKVVETMLAFARPAQVTVSDYPVSDLVDEALLLVQPRLKSKRIELVKEFHSQPVLRVDKQQVLQVLLNLLNNAIDVLPEQGRIRVTTGIRPLESTTDGEVRDFAFIEVADNGPGIPAAVRHRIFDPFFTTKKEGTGLGLSISQKIIRDHGGNISVVSTEGHGASFRVNLPMVS
jgi:nitrogen-specific signal transduction histidine kinase